jgi:hypothetical protein
MISHTVRLVTTPAPRQTLSRPPSRGGIISLPNPFKALKTTHLGVPNTVEITELVGRIEVNPQAEMGVVPVEGTIMANRIVLTNDGMRAIFWTESGLTVSIARNYGGHSLTRSRSFKHNPTASERSGRQRCPLPM